MAAISSRATKTSCESAADRESHRAKRWPPLVACPVTAAVVRAAGRRFDGKEDLEPTRVAPHDEQLSRMIRSPHTLLRIPLEYRAPAIAFGGGIYCSRP